MKHLITCFILHTTCVQATERIAVIDTGLSLNTAHHLCKDASVSLDGTSPFIDTIGHGTNIVGLIKDNVGKKDVCFIIIKLPVRDMNPRVIATAVKYAVSMKASYINMSLQGKGFMQEEYDAIKDALNKGIVIAVAAGNQGIDLDRECNVYPACYKFNEKLFHVVGRKDGEGNNGRIVKWKENGARVGWPMLSGTSQATAIHLGKYIKERK